METGMTCAQAWDLLRQYNEEPFHLQHALTVEAVMRWFANELGYGADADFWATCGLLHDVDFERWPEQHCAKAAEIAPLCFDASSELEPSSLIHRLGKKNLRPHILRNRCSIDCPAETFYSLRTLLFIDRRRIDMTGRLVAIYHLLNSGLR